MNSHKNSALIEIKVSVNARKRYIIPWYVCIGI